MIISPIISQNNIVGNLVGSRGQTELIPGAPVIEEYILGGSDATSGTVALSVPSGVTSGELLVAWAGQVYTSAVADNFTVTSGWTKLDYAGDDIADYVGAVFYKIADGTETTVTITWGATANKLFGGVVRISGADASNPFDTYYSDCPSNAGSSVTLMSGGAHTQPKGLALTVGCAGKITATPYGIQLGSSDWHLLDNVSTFNYGVPWIAVQQDIQDSPLSDYYVRRYSVYQGIVAHTMVINPAPDVRGDRFTSTAKPWHLQQGVTAYLANGKRWGEAYHPAMHYSNAGSYYDTSCNVANTGLTAFCRFKVGSRSNEQTLIRIESTGGATVKCRLSVLPYTDADADKLRLRVENSSGTAVCNLISTSTVADYGFYTVFASYDNATGATSFYINGVDEDDTGNANRVTPVAATLEVDASGDAYFGGMGASGLAVVGYIGPIWYSDWDVTTAAYGSNTWEDFMESDGTPKYINTVSWPTSKYTKPSYYNPHGEMRNNYGSQGNCTKYGTIYVSTVAADL